MAKYVTEAEKVAKLHKDVAALSVEIMRLRSMIKPSAMKTETPTKNKGGRPKKPATPPVPPTPPAGAKKPDDFDTPPEGDKNPPTE